MLIKIKLLIAKFAMLYDMATTELGKLVRNILKESEIPITKVEISMMVINSNGKKYRLQSKRFMYPASLVKVFIAAETFRQIDAGVLSLQRMILISERNVVSMKHEIENGTWLEDGQKVSVGYLIELMLTESNNTAANELIDLVTRENINQYIIQKNGWHGSEIMRKFLPREDEDEKYRTARQNATCAEHMGDFFQKLKDYELLSKRSTDLFLSTLLHSKTNSKVSANLPKEVRFMRKGGWHSQYNQKGVLVRYTSEGGIIVGPDRSYIIAYLTVLRDKNPKTIFPSALLTKKVYEFLKGH